MLELGGEPHANLKGVGHGECDSNSTEASKGPLAACCQGQGGRSTARTQVLHVRLDKLLEKGKGCRASDNFREGVSLKALLMLTASLSSGNGSGIGDAVH